MRRLKLKANEIVYQVRPSFMMPYMIGETAEVEKGLYLLRWGVPFEALAYVFGRDPMSGIVPMSPWVATPLSGLPSKIQPYSRTIY